MAYGLMSLPGDDDTLALIILVAMCGLAQVVSVPLFSGSSVSLAFAISFISLLLFGPAGAILANLGGAAVYAFYPKRRAWYKIVFNTGVLTISAASAGATYALVGGHWPARDLISAAVPAGTAAVVYFLANSALVSLAVSLTTDANFRTVFNESHRWLILHYLTIAAISLMAALGFRSMGWAGLLAFSLPLLMPWVSTRMYVAQTKTVIARNADLIQVNAKLAEANASLQRRVEEMGAFYRVGMALNRSLETQHVLGYIASSVRELTRAHGVAIYLYDKEHNTLKLESQVGLSAAYLAKPELSLNGSASRAIGERRRIVLQGDSGNSDFLSLPAAEEGIVASACLPLAVGNEVVGALDVSFKEPHVFSDNEFTVLETFAEQAAAGIHSARLYQQVHESYLSTIAALVATVEAKDPYTRGHSERVRDYTLATGLQMNLGQEDLDCLELAALFHDIGKIGIPENVLGKNGSLTDDEWQLIKRHPVVAESILKHVPTLAETIPIIRSHHERCDGKGYPDGLDGEIPRLSAIIGVADAYDAMMSDRPYRKAMEKEYAIAQLKTGAGSQFDAEVVEAFLAIIEPEANRRPPAPVTSIQFRRTVAPTTIRLWNSNIRPEWV
ncbi:MAG: GAF domain-containing protein [Chloroflexi bacterium]|nr:GAF domain-containing protein [Chloroflexota bacterium]